MIIQLLGTVFVMSRIIKVSVRVISLSFQFGPPRRRLFWISQKPIQQLLSYQQCGTKVVLFLQLSRRTLHKAAVSGRCDFIKVLLENGEDVDQMDEVARSILRLNVSVFVPFVSEIEKYFSFTRCSALILQFSLTPLHLAAWYGQRGVAELLLKHGANVNAVDRVSW